jgi:lipopolysaccharide heptosyltransferase II
VILTPAAVPLLEPHPAVRWAIPYDKRGADRGWSGLRHLARRLRAEHYAVAYLPHQSLRSAALALLAGIPRRVGFRGGWGRLYSERRARPRTGHEVDRLLQLVDGVVRPSGQPVRHLTADDMAQVARLLAQVGVAPPFIALAPGSIWGSKRWPHFAALAARLAQRHDVVLVGGPDDAELGEAIARDVADRATQRVVNAAGNLTLRQSAALIRRARVLVTNDSAPLHLAQAVGTPTVAIFGPTTPAFGFGPRGPHDVVVETEGLACRPCSSHGPPACPLRHHRCMQALGVEAVMQALERIDAVHRRD